jgi:hypothetical protein
MPRIALIAPLTLVAALAGCASGGTPESSATLMAQPAIYQSSETGTIRGERPVATSLTIAASPQIVWLAAKSVYGDLQIPITLESPPSGQLGNTNFWKTRQIAGESMVSLVNCGSDMTGPKAATYRIYMSLITDVRPDGKGGTTAHTTLSASGQDMSGTSSDRIPCGSTGKFEQMVLDRIKAYSGKS